MLEGVLVAEGGGLEFDLVGDAVGGEVSTFGERDTVFCPLLSEVFGHQFLEHLAFVVLRGGAEFFEVFGGAKHDCFGVEFEDFTLIFGGLEAEAHSVATARTVKFEDVGQDIAFRKAGDDVAVFGKAENVIVGKCYRIVAVNHGFEKGGVVHHFGYLLSSFVNSIISLLQRKSSPAGIKKRKKFGENFVQFDERLRFAPLRSV